MKDKDFTLNTRLWHVKHCKQFKPFKKYILAPRQRSGRMTLHKIGRLDRFYNIDPSETARTLNFMRKGIDGGNVSYIELSHRDAGLYPFIIGKNKPFVLVLAGGGYGDVCSIIEAFPTAVRLNELGYNAFVGQYRVGRHAVYPNPMDDVAEMLGLIFKKAESFGVSAKNYAVCGFSAGGHLAACWGTKRHGWAKYKLPKPGCMWLCYPVITMGEYTHIGSRDLIAGKKADKKLLESLSVEKVVDGSYPKTFIWQCTGDDEVSFINSELMAKALERNGVKHELYPVDYNKHGLGLGTGTPAEGWIDKAVALWQNENKK